MDLHWLHDVDSFIFVTSDRVLAALKDAGADHFCTEPVPEAATG